MSTLTASPPTDAGRRVQVPGVTPLRLLRSEWTKFRSLRSTMGTLVVAVVLTVGLSLLFAVVTASQWSTYAPKDRAEFNPIGVSLGGFVFSQLAFGVLAVLCITGEYSTGMIRASLTAVPRRLPVLWAKLAVYSVVVFGLSLAMSLLSFSVGQVLLHDTGRAVGLGAPGAVRSVVGVAASVAVVGILALGLGATMRNTAAAVSTFVGVFFVLPPLTSLLPESWSSHISPYLPFNLAGDLWGLGGSRADAGTALGPWTGFGLLCVYAAVLVVTGAWRLHRSDA